MARTLRAADRRPRSAFLRGSFQRCRRRGARNGGTPV